MAAVRRLTPGQLLMWILLVIGAFFCVFPFFWMLVGTTLNPNDVVLGVLVPGKELHLNWEKVTKTYDILTFFVNSLKIALLTVVFGLFVNGLAAFSFEKYRSRARELIFGIMLLTLIVPQMAIVIPMFRQIAFLKLLNTHAAIIMPWVMSVFIIFFLRQNFKMFPTEILEAARVDGAHELRIFFSIVVPSMKATFASASIYIFLLQWNSYLWPLMTILTDEKKTLPLAIFSMMRAYTIEYGAVMVAVCISTFPVLILFLVMQRQFVEGLLGSVK
jgi:lactose/L-arabinose transport system permease protein